MRRVRTALMALCCACALALGLAPAASAGDTGAGGDELSGRWKSAALKMDGVGWSMVLSTEGVPYVYEVAMRFNDQDGKRGVWRYGTLRHKGTHVSLRLEDESSPLRGTVGMDGSIFLPTCYTQLAFAPKKMADESCLFQEMPRR